MYEWYRLFVYTLLTLCRTLFCLDEANPSVSAIVHQMTDGAQFALHSFGDNSRATVGWHVDPFGHSWVTGGLWAEIGFDAFGINRINYVRLFLRLFRAQLNLSIRRSIWREGKMKN